MGRMAEARRRARQKQAASPEAPASPAPADAPPGPAEPLEPRAESAPPASSEPSDSPPESPRRASALVQVEATEAAPGRLVLPTSGLAEEVLGVVASEAPPAAAPEPAETAPVEPAKSHHFTFFATPERETREQVEATEHLVTFAVGNEEYGVDVRLAQEIIRVPAMTAVPRAPDFVRGVINLRGRIIPVVDFKTKLGLGRVDDTQRRARILIVRLKGRLLGLLVDGASQVLKVPVSAIDAAPEDAAEIEAAFIRGVAKLETRLVILVDLLAILAPELRAAAAATGNRT